MKTGENLTRFLVLCFLYFIDLPVIILALFALVREKENL